ncbi:ATP-binding protein [Oligella ureolytica]|nr:ATP-binding protein [Alcaligenaceae bacterium]
MKLILENIGMLKKAEITLNQLVVIAGENDNGKSTVGKVIFCLVKAINRYKEDLQESQEHKIKEKAQEFYFVLRRAMIDFDDKIDSLYDELRHSINTNKTYENQAIYKNIIEVLKLNKEIDQGTLAQLEQISSDIDRIANEPEDLKTSIENALKKVFASEFDSDLLYIGTQNGSIKLFENDTKLLDINIDKNNKITLKSEVEPIELKDATFIESPLILNNHDLLVRSQSALALKKQTTRSIGIPFTTLHTKDLFDKLQEPSLSALFNNDLDKNHALEIDKIINGEILYDPKARDFVFKRDKNQISIKNTASGSKVFGILQLLFRNDFINKNTIIIFDEPENHLHPNWQLKLAKILVDFSKEGVYIMVSSHSPYMIEALQRFSDTAEIKSKTCFYLAENNSIEDRNRLADIFRVLSEPFEIFRQMDKVELGFE